MSQANFINLDHNATTPPFPEVVALVAEVMAEGGNPSSVHAKGRAATQRLETARRQVANLCKARARDVTFCGSATEANNTLIHHFYPDVGSTEAACSEAEWRTGPIFLRPATEHDAVLAAAPGQDLALASNGHADLEALEETISEADQPILLAIMAANNETGLISNFEGILAVVTKAREAGAKVHYHIDAVQAAGKLPINFQGWGCDSLALSAHKMGGPQGVGALITRPGFEVTPLIRGGGQERRRRAGTENVAGIAGFGLACDLAQDPLDTIDLRTKLEKGLKAANPEAEIVGEHTARLGNTTCLLTPGKSAETLLMQFDLAGIGLSSGSACSSGKVGASHVLTALGYDEAMARSALRFSLGRETTAEHIDRAVQVYEAACH